MADPRDELLRQIRAIRRRIDPDVLEKAAAAAERMQTARSAPTGPPPAEESPDVPFDRQAARDVVMTFLQSRHDGGRFAMKLMEEMKKPEAAAKAYGQAATKTTKPARKV
ncbi:hypothetical protein [Nitrospirillum viridazoti]|uniref:Uncharacterized protein n=1 Tax=Nitrospirillum viridazoti CBAmc TaxID=1441467 RepID=A0A248JVA9_9PROT|nr:hypothetical protein [Nitrospirillum amazonense]ASG22653.1 hypothetical protein Y958_17185 [Nitrospirillum amazonense CBAmc]TWB30164.1 hypothetical protein FBZ91_12310 [Nitrospirillum amazonense]